MSLNEGQVRRALVFEIYLDEEGSVVMTQTLWGLIRSVWKGTYGKVQDYYDAMDKGKATQHPLHSLKHTETIGLLREVGNLRLKIAKERHVVEYQRESSGVSIDKKGFLAFTEPRMRLDSERYNEQISLLCNSEGGKLLSDLAKGGGQRNNNPGPSVVQAIFRTQKGPSEDGIRTLAATILETIRAHKLPQDVWAWDSKKEFLSDYLGRLQRLCKVGADADEDAKSHKTVLASIERQAMLGRGGRCFK